ncbi:MAG TPA: hypothetical protein VM598_07330, partial [Bdellovibrionota bacterium]|nr:hypothetical protein [Bdellovibrionota bacterium]
TGRSRLLYSVANRADRGVLHPHFSPDGKSLTWSEMIAAPSSVPGFEAGQWRLMMAPIAIDPWVGLKLAGTPVQLAPGELTGVGPGFIENHGFTPNGKYITFSANFESVARGLPVTHRSDIYATESTLDARSFGSVRLTSTGYNEHGTIGYRGDRESLLAYMSTRWNPWWLSSLGMAGGTEFTLARYDGSEPCQLTHFNTPGYPEYLGFGATAADLEWSRDGRRLVGYTHSSLGSNESIWVFDFND